MIRRDYILRMVQELAQALARVISLQRRQEHEAALREIESAFRQLQGPSGSVDIPEVTRSVEDWIRLCRSHGMSADGLMLGIADLLEARTDSQSDKDTDAARRDRETALRLRLEVVLDGEGHITAPLLDRIDAQTVQIWPDLADGAVWQRLIRYFEARGRHARAEDAVFAWLATGDPDAIAHGRTFYARTLQRSDDELKFGNLPRSELAAGQAEFEQRASRLAKADGQRQGD